MEDLSRLALFTHASSHVHEALLNLDTARMTAAITSSFGQDHISIWLRGLLSIAWADGHFDQEEQDLIASLTQNELAPNAEVEPFEPISPTDLADNFGEDPKLSENFLRTAVMVAIADGVYSPSEDALLHEFCQALRLDDAILDSLRHTLIEQPSQGSEEEVSEFQAVQPGASSGLYPPAQEKGVKPLRPVKDWLDQLDIDDPSVARFLCKMIPPQCPFERDVKLFGHKVVHIPPLCKLNPLYEQLVGLRFRALSYLAEECEEDISPYC